MGLLNRHLHGGSSAASSQRGRGKAAAQQQPVLLYEPVTSGQHWPSSSGQPLLPPGLVSQSSRDLGPGQPGRGDQQAQQAQGAQRSGSPASSEGGGSSFYSGELPGSPDKRLPAGECLAVLTSARGGDGRPLDGMACVALLPACFAAVRVWERWLRSTSSPPCPAHAGHNRSSSYAQRQAGTAQWVFDRANSANSGELLPGGGGGGAGGLDAAASET